MKFKDLKNVLFLDIETVSQESCFNKLSPELQSLWTQKAARLLKDKDPAMDLVKDLYLSRAGIFAEFSKIVCISVSYLVINKKEITSVKTKSFYGHDEHDLLQSFSALLNKHYNNPTMFFLSGHNIKEFDIPFICRRMVIHGINLPKLLNIYGKKPWQLNYLLDTLELWRFGDYKNYTSLKLLAAILGIPSPKNDIDGSQVGAVYWQEDDLERIKSYCEKDVLTSIRVFLRLYGWKLKEIVTIA